jgi:hypothetical protein
VSGKVGPNTHSVGVTTRQVTVSSITPDGSTAVCIDKTGVEVRVPMYWQSGKSPLPAAGENWILTQDLGQWAFSMIVASTSTPFTTWSGSKVTVNGSGSSALLAVTNTTGPAATLAGGAAGDHVVTVQSAHAGTTSAAELILMAAATDPAFGVQVTGDTNRRIGSDASGKFQWSSGTAAADLFFQRLSAAVAKLTGSLQITGSLYSDTSWTTKTSGFSNGWTGTFNYRLIAANLMVVAFTMVATSATVADATPIFTLPAAYQPNTARHLPACTDGVKTSPSPATTFESARVRIDNAGVVTCFGVNANSTFLDGCGLIPLDV